MLLLFRLAEWKLAKELSADLPAGTALFGVLQMTGLKATGEPVNVGRGSGSAARAAGVDGDGAAGGAAGALAASALAAATATALV
jgi:hypothetical protein